MTEAEWLTSDDPAAMLRHLNVIYKPGVVSEPGVYPAVRISDRKLRLFACAWWRSIPPHKEYDEQICRAVEGAGFHVAVDGEETDTKWLIGECFRMSRQTKSDSHTIAPRGATLLRCIAGNPFRPVTLPRRCDDCDGSGRWRDYGRECGSCGGSGKVPAVGPYRSRCPWLTPNVLSIAEAADRRATAVPCREGACGTGYREGPPREDGTLDPQVLAVLSDALEEAGCDSEELLRHLRGEEPCPHRGRNQLESAPDIELEYWADDCPLCDATGWRPLRGLHVRGCWAVDMVLGRE